MIEANKLWNNPWITLAPSQKLKVLKDVILEIANHLNTTEPQVREEIRKQLEERLEKLENV